MRLTTSRRRSADLIPDFLDANLANLIQERNDVPMGRHHFGADRDLDIRIGRVQLKKPRQNLIILDELIIEEDGVAGRNADSDVILLCLGRRCALSGQIYLNPFHVGLAEAHHHKAGQQEEHDVDQRNDLNARVLFRNG